MTLDGKSLIFVANMWLMFLGLVIVGTLFVFRKGFSKKE